MRNDITVFMLDSYDIDRFRFGHASVQTTQIYAESSQAIVDKNVREWNKKNIPKTLYCDEPDKDRTNIPDFLRSYWY